MKAYSKKRIDLEKISILKICDQEIAHALSLIGCENEPIKNFYSLGQHSLNCAKEAQKRQYSAGVILACLLYHATSAYVGDWIHASQQQLVEYERMKNKIFGRICQKYHLDALADEEWKLVREMDQTLYSYATFIFSSSDPQEACLEHFNHLDFELGTFEKIESEFLELLVTMKQRFNRQLKKNYRNTIKNILNNLPINQRREQEKIVMDYLMDLSEWKQAQKIALTKPMKLEFSLDVVINCARELKKRLFVPVTQPNYQLIFVEWKPETLFETNAFGVDEPIIQEPSYSLQEMDLIIVPGLSYSKKGERLGFGGGYYDRALAHLTKPTVSLAYKEQVCECAGWPVEPFDQRIQIIISEKGVWRTNEFLENETV